jgi:hypothetical protein
MSAGWESEEMAIRYFGSLEIDSWEATKPATRRPSSRQTVPKLSRMALLGFVVPARKDVVTIRVKGRWQ